MTINNSVQADRTKLTAGGIAEYLNAELIGDPELVLTSIASIQQAGAGSITFLSDRKYLSQVAQTAASAIVLQAEFAQATHVTRLVVDDPYLCYARLSRLFAPTVGKDIIHPSAVIADTVAVSSGVSIGANAVVEAGAQIGADSVIGAGVVIGARARIGDRVRVHANATIHYDCVVGDDCEIHSGAVVGADGFGWARGPDGWEKIHQLGVVTLGDRVSVGANTCIDRGALGDTRIESGVILDNLIQIAHNVHIGENTAIAGCVGIAGSTTIGSNCTIAGGVGIVGHLSICDKVHVTAKSFVNRSIEQPGSYSSAYPLEPTRSWRKNAVRLHKLDSIARVVKRLEKQC